ncbi:hypothetical protein GA0116948_105119 [Chitinophaga costaii]|uniref:Uncharacterized protein n=1 Tax=Chitinophaga costaii TaxID=1335309 RepID=A0A1C4D875_9BACT|nr:hypothetical protein GA0116948_105119 [Chitinophaga costaii]
MGTIVPALSYWCKDISSIKKPPYMEAFFLTFSGNYFLRKNNLTGTPEKLNLPRNWFSR